MWGPEAWLLLLLLASSTGRLAWATGTLASAPTLVYTRVHTHTHSLFPLTGPQPPAVPPKESEQLSCFVSPPASGQVTMSGVPDCLCQSLAEAGAASGGPDQVVECRWAGRWDRGNPSTPGFPGGALADPGEMG